MDIGEVMVISRPPGFNATRIVGEMNFSLACSAYAKDPLLYNVTVPAFEWFFGPDNSSLPSWVTVSTVTNSSNTYTSTLQFSVPLESSHSGLYTCRLGGNKRLAANTNITVKGISSQDLHIN